MARAQGQAADRTAELRRTQYQHGASEKGRRTRALLLRAARSVFERDGYADARVTDIASAAGVSHGSFYTYFESKLHIFRELSAEVTAEMLEALAVPAADEDGLTDFPTRLDVSNRHFLDVYRKNAGLMKLIEQQAGVDPEVGRTRTASRRAHVERITRACAGCRAPAGPTRISTAARPPRRWPGWSATSPTTGTRWASPSTRRPAAPR